MLEYNNFYNFFTTGNVVSYIRNNQEYCCNYRIIKNKKIKIKIDNWNNITFYTHH